MFDEAAEICVMNALGGGGAAVATGDIVIAQADLAVFELSGWCPVQELETGIARTDTAKAKSKRSGPRPTQK